MVKQKAKTKNFKDFLLVSVDELFDLGKSDSVIGDLFLKKIIESNKKKNFVWHKNQFEYSLWGARGELVAFFVAGVLEERALKVSKKSTKVKEAPVVVDKPKKKEVAKNTQQKTTKKKSKNKK